MAGIATPIAGLGQTSTGTSTQTTSTPFNPLSLAPLALAPFTGGTSLLGMGVNLAGGLLGNLGRSSNSFSPYSPAWSGGPGVGSSAY